MTGYSRGPINASTFGWQYEKLMGLHTLEGVVSSGLIEFFSIILAAAAVVSLIASRTAMRGVFVASILLPSVVCLLALYLVNFINPRYYLHASIALSLGIGILIAWMLQSRARAPFGVLLLCVLALALVRGISLSQNPPIGDLLESIRTENVQEIVVHPRWYGYHFHQQLEHAGLKTMVIDREVLDGPLPQWLFVKDPRYIWPKAGIVPPARLSFEEGYELMEDATYLRKYYFHTAVLSDRLLRRR
jgi:hypothetical protein